MRVRRRLPSLLPSRTVRAVFPPTALHRGGSAKPGPDRGPVSSGTALLALAPSRSTTSCGVTSQPLRVRQSTPPTVLRHELFYSGRRALAPTALKTPPRLRSLRCARLSPGVIATMNRSDASATPPRSVSPLSQQFPA